VQIPAAAPLDLPVAMPQRGVFPPNNVMVSDRSASTRVFRNQNMRSSVFQNVATPQATTVTAPVTASAIATALAILVNNQAAPDQDVLNFLSTTTIQAVVGANGQISFNSLVESQGDGLIHGDLIWDIDDAYSLWREDFRFLNQKAVFTAGDFISQLSWNIQVATGGTPTIKSLNPGPPFLGAILMGNAGGVGTTATNSTFIVPTANAAPNANALQWDALFEHPNWKMVWNFGLIRGASPATGLSNAFSMAQTSWYLGLANMPALTSYAATTVPRPPVFVGLRYDTDLGPALTLTGATAGAGTTAYAGTITGGASNAYVGLKFTVSGFTGGDAPNNGTFTCTASTASILTLNNGAGVTGSTGSSLIATGPQLNDASFTFEALCNSSFINVTTRSNIQGNTSVTGIVPTEGHFYRLEIECTTVGSVTMTLTDSVQTAGTGVTTAVAQFSATLAIPKFTCTNIEYEAGNGMALLEPVGTSDSPFTAGSIVTVAGTGQTGIDGVNYIAEGGSAGSAMAFFSGLTVTITNAPTATMTGYPAVYPFWCFGNNTTAATLTVNIRGAFLDYVAFVWNPGVGGNTSPASNPLLARYF
jgi:hypothetical protein